MNMSSIKCICACLVAYGVATSIPRIAAGSDGDALTDKARVLYDEAAISYQKSKYAEARASLLAAWSLKKHWQIAGSLGGCEVQLGLYREAAEHLAYFMRLSPNKPPSADTKKLFETATSKLGTLVISVDARGADLVVDGKFIGKSPMEDPVFVEPGHHTIEARLGSKRATVEADTPAGSSRKLPLTLVNASTPRGIDSDGPSRALVIGGAIASAAALGTGIAFVAVAGGKASDADAVLAQLKSSGTTCLVPPQAGPCEPLLSLRQNQGTFHNVGVPMLVGGGIGAIGTAIYALWPRSKSEPTMGLRALPAINPGSAGMWLTGTF